MAATYKSAPAVGVASKARNVVSLSNCSSNEREALDLALAYLIERNIKPKLTLKEFSDFCGTPLRQVQSDVERGYLPIVPRTIPNRRELVQVNMVAYYALMYLDAFNHLDKSATFSERGGRGIRNVFFNRLIDSIQQKRADDMRKAYQSRKAAVERQARQRL
ncbi:hypothetical protein AAH678_30900 [Sodalis endosymbiont of Spalangia cameroni]|uniref:hypothetical protein n=1 Tax=Sodalis praecaptivus TaxID=1239307 RepID=UPI0031F7D797